MINASRDQLPPNTDCVTLSLNELLFYKQHSVRWLPPAKSLWSQVLGQHQSRQLGRGMDFAEVRRYQPGDDIRSIDWRVTARTGKTHTKLFTEEREKPVVLYLDLSRSMFFGSQLLLKSVLMAHMASLISWLTVANNDRVGAVIDTGDQLIEIKPSSRNRGPLDIIQQLVSVHQKMLNNSTSSSNVDASLNRTGHSMEMGFKALNRLCPKGSELVILSDFTRYNNDCNLLLTRLSAHNRIRFVHISDPLEYGKTQFRGVEHVSNSNKNVWLDFSSAKNRQKIELAFLEQQEQLTELCRSLAISMITLSSDKPLLQQLSG